MSPQGNSLPILLGVDIGTESVRVLAVTAAGDVLGNARTPHPTHHVRPGWAEQSPRDWWDGLRKACAQLRDSGVPLDRVAGIGITATSSTVVFATNSGAPVRDALLWMDVRALNEAAAFGATRHRLLAWCPDGVSPEWGPPKAAWVRTHEPDTFQSAEVICEGGDWLIHRLTGEWTTNIPAAVTAWFYDARARSWPADFYAEGNVPELASRLPANVLPNGALAGQLSPGVAAELGLPSGTPVAQGGIDSVSAMLAMGVTAPGPVGLITGSSNVLLAQSACPVHAAGVWGGYPDAALPGADLVVGLHTAGSVVAWLVRDVLGGRYTLDELEAEASSLSFGDGQLIVLPDFQGNRTPFTEPTARGAIWGLSLAHGPAHLYRATIEGVALATRHGLEAIIAAGVSVDEIRACGGATRSPVTMQIYADVLGRTVTTTGVTDASALGAAISGAIGAGIVDDYASAAAEMGRSGSLFEPDSARHAAYDRRFELFRRTYPALLPLMRQMAEPNTRESRA